MVHHVITLKLIIIVTALKDGAEKIAAYPDLIVSYLPVTVSSRTTQPTVLFTVEDWPIKTTRKETVQSKNKVCEKPQLSISVIFHYILTSFSNRIIYSLLLFFPVSFSVSE